MDQLDHAVRKSFEVFIDRVFATRWRGREREAISFYALGFLQQFCSRGGVLRDPTQIVIEAAVPGIASNRKGRVNKDLVVWPAPGMTCWNERWQVVNDPMAIQEWKVARAGRGAKTTFDAHDVDWLKAFSRSRPRFVGYAVMMNLTGTGDRLSVCRVHGGAKDDTWLRL